MVDFENILMPRKEQVYCCDQGNDFRYDVRIQHPSKSSEFLKLGILNVDLSDDAIITDCSVNVFDCAYSSHWFTHRLGVLAHFS